MGRLQKSDWFIILFAGCVGATAAVFVAAIAYVLKEFAGGFLRSAGEATWKKVRRQRDSE